MNLSSEVNFIPVNIAILSISDTRDLSNDKSGDIIQDRALKAGHSLHERLVVKDDFNEITQQLQLWVNDNTVDVVITTGGTGLTGRDVTVEAHQSIYEKEIPGFAIIFAQLSYTKIKASAVQSRACAGVANGTYLFALPGSPSACIDAWDGILKTQLDVRNKPCNFVEIMPRLDEHRRK